MTHLVAVLFGLAVLTPHAGLVLAPVVLAAGAGLAVWLVSFCRRWPAAWEPPPLWSGRFA